MSTSLDDLRVGVITVQPESHTYQFYGVEGVPEIEVYITKKAKKVRIFVNGIEWKKP
ncbi:MAG: hypothetical protein L0G87_01340 [Renibacterium salmoninarum]|nr:hypothetical protein [Renibacterium salmoninarum]